MTYIAEIETRIAGIPCIIAVTEYDDEDSSISLDYVVCDRRGRPAPWLACKLTAKTAANVDQVVINHYNQ